MLFSKVVHWHCGYMLHTDSRAHTHRIQAGNAVASEIKMQLQCIALTIKY